jgi:hypothetical protein
MSINSDNSSLFDSTLSTSSASPASAASKKRKEETGAKGESHSEITEEQSHMTSSSFLESEAMNQLQQEISSRDVEEQLKEKEDKQPEDQVKRQKKAISEEVVEVPTDSISSPTLSSESLIIPSSIIFLGSSSSSPIPLSLADPRISESFSSSPQELNQSSSITSSSSSSSISEILPTSFETLNEKAKKMISTTMTVQQINEMYNAFFSGDEGTRASSEQALSQNNPSSPSMSFVFKRLHDCLTPLLSYETFDQVIDAREVARQADQLDSFPVVTPLDIDPFSHNIHQVFFLRDQNQQIGWVFKPDTQLQDDGEGHKIRMQFGEPDRASREHTASLVNFHHLFPIPITVRMDVLGYEGSAQLFVDGAIEVDDIPVNSRLNAKAMHSLLIFDLLFSNQDRNLDNIIFRKNEEEFFPFGIDHDVCMCYGEKLKIDYLNVSEVFDLQLLNDLECLISAENIQKYKGIMIENGRSTEAIEWVELASRTIKIYYSIEEEAKPTAKDLCNFLVQTFTQINNDEIGYGEMDEAYITSKLTTK